MRTQQYLRQLTSFTTQTTDR